ncbi:hypothetical protein M9H77_08758 [Catharanthus roseus]|uniref:Uncharacterized protein n=1 Tax=Catharanthus roseus TaxID=4058 RepID=A0ACC0BZ09_CATRO|nr:hypothetical protein M9H77_08758 [Catharanthus roseus]
MSSALRICFDDRTSGLFLFVNICENPILTRDKVLDMIVYSKAASSNDMDCFRLWKVDPLERGRNTTLHHALRWDSLLVESQEGLVSKVGLRADLVGAPGSVAWFYVNGEYGGYGIERSPTFALHLFMNSGVEVALTCLDLLRLPGCIRTPYIGLIVSTFKITKENNITDAHTRGLT